MACYRSSAAAAKLEAGAAGIDDIRGGIVADSHLADTRPWILADRHCDCPFVDARTIVATLDCSEGCALAPARLDTADKEKPPMRVAGRKMTLPPRWTERLPNVGRD